MNDKIRRFTTQLSDAAPLAPELDGRALPASRTPLTAMRVGIAVGVVGVLGVVALTVAGSEDRASVVPASDQTGSEISDAIQAVLPDGFRLELVERRDSPDAAPSPASVPAHAVAVNDRLEVLDIEFMALTQPEENLQPDEMSPDTGPTEDMSSGGFITNTTVTENASSGELVTDTTVGCITTTSVQGAVECLQYSDEGTAATTPPAGTGSIVTETTVPGDGSSTIEEGTSPVYDPFGVDPSGTPSPFQGASTRTSNLYVQIAHYAINQGVDVAALSSAVASSLEQIPNLAEAIASLPEPLAPADLNLSSPREGLWVNGAVTSGSLSVSLWRGLTDGAVIVRISYPGSLEASGNDGDVFWQALTPSAGDGRVSIVHFLRGSRDALSDADAAALTYKIADFWTDARAVIPVITQNILSAPAGGDQPPVTEAPVETTVLSAP